MRKAEKSNGILLQLAEKRVDHRGTIAVGHDEPRGGGGGADLDQRNVETRPLAKSFAKKRSITWKLLPQSLRRDKIPSNFVSVISIFFYILNEQAYVRDQRTSRLQRGGR